MTASVRVAAVDIGTNTVRLLIADVDSSGVVTWRERRALVSRLGEGVDRGGSLTPKAIERTTEVLAGYATAIDAADCDAAAAIATSAAREAANREAFLDLAEAALSLRPRVVTGDEEAGLTFVGTTAGVVDPGPHLVIDPGGGSTEFVLGDRTVTYATSVDIGSVRLSERALFHHPVRPGELAAARDHAAELFADVRLPVIPAMVFGVAGTFTSLAAVYLALDVYDSDRVHGTQLTVDDMHDVTDRLAALTIDEIAAIPAMDPKRAPVITGGAVVAEQALLSTGSGVVIVSERDSLDGLAAETAAQLLA